MTFGEVRNMIESTIGCKSTYDETGLLFEHNKVCYHLSYDGDRLILVNIKTNELVKCSSVVDVLDILQNKVGTFIIKDGFSFKYRVGNTNGSITNIENIENLTIGIVRIDNHFYCSTMVQGVYIVIVCDDYVFEKVIY